MEQNEKEDISQNSSEQDTEKNEEASGLDENSTDLNNQSMTNQLKQESEETEKSSGSSENSTDLKNESKAKQSERDTKSNERTSGSDESPTDLKKQKFLHPSLVKKPVYEKYKLLPTSKIEMPEKEDIIDRNIEAMEQLPGFSDLRKFRKVNETRIITPYKPESLKEKESEILVPQIFIENPSKFLLDRTREIPVSSLQSIIQMVQKYPDIGHVNMNRTHMDLVMDYMPYDYTICHYSKVDKMNYITISPHGLVEFYKGDEDFLPLDRLVVEFKIFLTLQKIPFFCTFRIWKAFMIWFKKTRSKRFVEARDKLEMFFNRKFGYKKT